MQVNIATKFAEYMVWILLCNCKHSKFGKKFTTIPEISIFSYGFTFLARPVVENTTVHIE